MPRLAAVVAIKKEIRTQSLIELETLRVYYLGVNHRWLMIIYLIICSYDWVKAHYEGFSVDWKSFLLCLIFIYKIFMEILTSSELKLNFENIAFRIYILNIWS